MKLYKLSVYAKQFLNTPIGYRNDSYYGSGVTDLKKILMFEYEELGNEDALDFCQEHHFNQKFSSPQQTIKAIIMYCQQVFNTNKVYGVWVAPKNAVRRIYGGAQGRISAYEFRGKPFILLSDLGEEGLLIAVPQDPYYYKVF